MQNKMVKISTKLTLGFGVVLFLALGAGLFSVISYINTMENYKHYVYTRIGQIDGVNQLNADFRGQIKAFDNIILRGNNPQDLKKYKEEFDILDEHVVKEAEELISGEFKVTSTENKKRIMAFKTAYADLHNLYEQAILEFRKNFNPAAADSLVRAKDLELSTMLHEIVVDSKNHTAERSEIIANQVRARGIVILIIFIFAAVVGVIFAIFISRNISVPVVTLSEAANQMAKGDLTLSIPVKSNDEIGLLSGSFDDMVKSLKEILTKSQSAVGQITSASTEILSASQQQSAGAREQSSAINETTSAALELAKSAEAVGENIKHVASIANHALAGMAKIKDAIGKTGEKITSLSEKSQQIGKITELINDVADQTNLLAVNAAIEAARAGEEGRGFAVVADEIRKLADSTAKSTKDITALVEIIQHEMSNAIISMEQSTNNVNEEVKLAQESAESAKEISMSATQQVAGSKQIADAMANINEAMKQIAAGASQAQAAAQQLNGLAKELKDTTAKFKLA